MNRVTLEIDRDLRNLHIATGVGKEVCNLLQEEQLVSPQFCMEFELVLSEALTNAIVHGEEIPHNKKVRLNIAIEDRLVAVQICERGPGFDLDAVPEPDFDSFPEHGYGLSIIREKCSQVRYFKNQEDWNVLELIKEY